MKRVALRGSLPAIVVLACATVAWAAPPSLDQILSLRGVRNARLSPDGALVCYEVSDTDWKDNAYVSQLWLAEIGSGRTWQLTRGKKSSDSASWSPDGRWLAFMTERDAPAGPAADKTDDERKKENDGKPDPRQIWLISPTGGEAWVLTKHAAPIQGFRWSRDGRRIAFVAAAPESKAMKERKDKYGDYDVFEEDFDQAQIWTVDVAGASVDAQPVAATRVTSDTRRNVTGLDWSPDGTKIVFAASTSPLLAYRDSSDLFLLDVATGAVSTLVAFEGPESSPRFSPDGTMVAFETALGDPWHYYANGHIATVRVADALREPATKTSQVTDLTSGFDEDASLIDWSAAGVWFEGLQKTSSHVFLVSPMTRTIARVTSPDAFYVGNVSFSADFATMAFTASDPAQLTEVFVASVPAEGAALQPRKLTDVSAQIASWTVGTQEMIRWRSTDGSEIEGVLHKPADFDPSKKYPLLVVIHGGPTGISRPTRSFSRYYPIEQFLARGALVLEPNYRGSAGYGSKFRALNVRNLGVGDMWDVMSGVDSLITKGIVDPARLGAMGWSQGGYISAFLTTNTDRFKAISVGAGISNWMTYYVNTDITPFTRQYLQATPWDDPDVYARTSPMTNIRKARTPTLIQHGERDKRVPPPNAFELYRGLRDVGVPARLIVYAGYGHGITKPKSNRAVLQHNLDWFGHYVFGDPFPPGSPLFGSGARTVTEHQ